MDAARAADRARTDAARRATSGRRLIAGLSLRANVERASVDLMRAKETFAILFGKKPTTFRRDDVVLTGDSD